MSLKARHVPFSGPLGGQYNELLRLPEAFDPFFQRQALHGHDPAGAKYDLPRAAPGSTNMLC
jgi:hypothetical protein